MMCENPDLDRLLDYKIPARRQIVTRKDLAFYALSIGVGQDPLDRWELDFVDSGRENFAAMPSIVAVLCHPGFWFADPATGIDVVKVVHGEQGFVIHAPIPCAGAILGHTRVTGVADKGAGKGALIHVEKTLIDEASGRHFATVTSAVFARGNGGFRSKPDAALPITPIPDTPPAMALDLATRPEQALYYRLNGDMNPLHADPDAAARAGFSKPILHGLATKGVVCHALVKQICNGDPVRLRAVDLRFSAPVYPGETIRTEIWPDGRFRALVPERGAVVVNNGRAIAD